MQLGGLMETRRGIKNILTFLHVGSQLAVGLLSHMPWCHLFCCISKEGKGMGSFLKEGIKSSCAPPSCLSCPDHQHTLFLPLPSHDLLLALEQIASYGNTLLVLPLLCCNILEMAYTVSLAANYQQWETVHCHKSHYRIGPWVRFIQRGQQIESRPFNVVCFIALCRKLHIEWYFSKIPIFEKFG